MWPGLRVQIYTAANIQLASPAPVREVAHQPKSLEERSAQGTPNPREAGEKVRLGKFPSAPELNSEWGI